MPRPAPRLAPVTTATQPVSGLIAAFVSIPCLRRHDTGPSHWGLGRIRTRACEKFCRRQTTNGPELVGKMRLVVETAGDRHIDPGGRHRAPEAAETVMQPGKAAAGTRRHADV